MVDEAELAQVLRSLRGVLDEEAVDELDHALQCAANQSSNTRFLCRRCMK